jgi:signal transduction histidine kinase
MTTRTASRLAWSIVVATLAVVAVDVVLVVMNRTAIHAFEDVSPIETILPIGLSIVGALIASRRPASPIGWMFLAIALIGAIPGVAVQYVVRDTLHPGTLPGVQWMAWLNNWIVGLIFPSGAVTFLFLLFPNGRFLSRRWRIFAGIAMAHAIFFIVVQMFDPSPIQVRVHLPEVPNPLGVRGFPTSNGPAGAVGWLGGILILAVAAVSVVVRLRRSKGEQRQQVKWFAYAVASTVGALLVYTFASIVDNNLPTGPFDAIILLGFGIALPIACGIAILKHGLYEIDVVINKTVMYGVLAAFFTAVYVGIVVGIGAVVGSNSNRFLTVAAAVVIAVAFQPVRERARRFANRLVYGKRATPYEVLSEFSERVAGSYSTEDVLPRIAEILGSGTGAARAEVWLRVGSELRPAAHWPEGKPGHSTRPIPIRGEELPALPVTGSNGAVPVRHQGELLGALAVTMPPSEPFGPTQEKLVQDLAAQAGLVLRNVRLTEELKAKLQELQASRQRLVTATDEARRKLERNIHDGAQQQLVAMAVKLRLAEALIGRDPDKERQLISQLQAETTEALETLRELARGIYPPLLADRGLAEALTAQARKVPVPVDVEAVGIGRYPQAAEAAVYFCCLEALQNIAKYAEASRVIVSLGSTDGYLTFAVRDDGVGFDQEQTGPGSGLQNMADRLSAIGGDLEIRSKPGEGTVILGRIPTKPVGSSNGDAAANLQPPSGALTEAPASS